MDYNIADMDYLSTFEISKKWGISERSVRDYCSKGRVVGAIIDGKTWLIPKDAKKPSRQARHVIKADVLLNILKREKDSKLSGGIYHKLQVEMTYNSNHIEGSKLTHDQTRHIFETKTVGVGFDAVLVDDIIETSNHFRCIDFAIESANGKLTEAVIKQFHFILKSGTSDTSKSWFKVGDYKMYENEVGGIETTSPKEVKSKIKSLLSWYNSKSNITIDDIIEFHYRFECIHPFQDGNGRVGRLIMLKECLKHGIVPILILDEYKAFYYRGLKEWKKAPGYLTDTCLFGQDIFKKYLDHFKIKY